MATNNRKRKRRTRRPRLTVQVGRELSSPLDDKLGFIFGHLQAN